MSVHLASSDGFPAPFVRPAAPEGGGQDDGRVVPDGWVAEPRDAGVAGRRRWCTTLDAMT